MNQSEFLAIIGHLLKAREKSRVQGAIGFASHWLKNGREIFNPINQAKQSQSQSCNYFQQSFDKTALVDNWRNYIWIRVTLLFDKKKRKEKNKNKEYEPTRRGYKANL